MMETKVLNNQATFAVRFPDGTMISESGKVRFETFKSVIKRIGMERVAAYAKISKRKRLKQPYVNKSKNEILENVYIGIGDDALIEAPTPYENEKPVQYGYMALVSKRNAVKKTWDKKN